MIRERTIRGLHDYLAENVLGRLAVRGEKAVDLGTARGAMAVRLQELGVDVTAVGDNPEEFEADLPFVRLDLNDPDFSSRLVARLSGRLYAPLARKRAKNLWYRFPVEIQLARLLGIYGKQD